MTVRPWAIWGALALAIGIAAAVASGPVGTYHDDGIYIGSAISLVQGEGYRIPHLPDAPWQAKYPPLLPWLLTPIAACTGAPGATGLSDGALASFRLPIVCCVWGALALLPGLFRRWGMSPRAACWGLAVTGCSPLVFQHAFHVMSEGPFLLCTVAALRLMPSGDEPPSVGRWGGLAGCVVAAILCRSVGIALLPAVAWVGWTRRREWAAWVPLAAGVIAFVAWSAVAGAARAAEAERELGLLYRYYLGYGAWITTDVGALASVFAQNLVESWLAFGTSLCGVRVLGVPGWQLLAAAAGTAAVAGWRWLPGTALPAALYLGASLGLFWIWPFPVDRFLVPLTPFAVWGAWRVGNELVERGGWSPRVRPIGGSVLLGGCILATLVHFPTPNRLPLLNGYQPGPGYVAAAEWIRANTAPEDIVVANDDPWVWLATGRRSLPPGDLDPLWIYGGPPTEPKAWPTYWKPKFEQFDAECRRLGARWLLGGQGWDPHFDLIWGPGVVGNPERFRLAWPPEGPGKTPLWVFEFVR